MTTKGLLCAAIAAALCATTDVHAVTVNPRGTGQVLLFPYYTVDGGNQTLVTLVNTTRDTKAVRVRFLEGANSRSVYDFNVYLAPYDAWVGAIASVPGQQAAQLVPADDSCTVPRLDQLSPAQLAFRNNAYTGIGRDHPVALAAELGSLERTREGHIEMIEMGLLTTGTSATQLAEEASPTPGFANCMAPAQAWTPPAGGWVIDGRRDILAPTGGLAGNASIVDVAEGTMVSYAAIALEDFYTDAAAPGALHNSPGQDAPDLAAANNGGGFARADVEVDGVGPLTELFPAGATLADAVSLALMRTSILNDYESDPAIGGATEWVVTFPTKRYHADQANISEVRPPFRDAFRDDGRARERVFFGVRDREGAKGYDPCDLYVIEDCALREYLDFSVNVVAFAPAETAASPTAIFASTPNLGAYTIVPQSSAIPAVPFGTGWAAIAFYRDLGFDTEGRHEMIGPTSGLTYRGLPAIGFAATRIVNRAARPGLIANYAGAQPHRGTLEASLVEARSQGRDPTP